MMAQARSSVGLQEMLVEATVAVGVAAANWEGAVEEVGRLLVSAGVTRPEYINAMKRTIRELGSYSVIAPGIAMPHARPEDGVLRTGFALITLDPPVKFGNEANDPVDIVVAFAALDKETHIQALQQIATVLRNQAALAGIRAAENKQQLLDEIYGYIA